MSPVADTIAKAAAGRMSGPEPGQPPASLVLVHGAGSGPWVYDGWSASFGEVDLIAVDLQAGLDVARASHDDYAGAVVAAARDHHQRWSCCDSSR